MSRATRFWTITTLKWFRPAPTVPKWPWSWCPSHAIFTALCTAGLAARQDGRRYVTQSSHINFLTNCRQGTVRAVAQAVRRGRQLAVFRVQVLAEDGKLMADGTVDMFCTGDAAHE